MDDVDVEMVMRVHTKDGECFEIGPDSDGLDMVEIRCRDSAGVLSNSHRISLPREVWNAMRTYEPEAGDG